MVTQQDFEDYLQNNHCVNRDFWFEAEAFGATLGRPFERWTEEDFYAYLRSKKFKTYLTALQYISMVTGFIADLTRRGKATPELRALGELKMDTYALENYIDIPYVLSLILNVREYETLRSYFNRNVRDRLILELAWTGLTTGEIRNLRKKDVTVREAGSARCAEIKTPASTFVTYDECTVDDLEAIANVTEHIVETTSGVQRRLPYIEDSYGEDMRLIRNASIRRKSGPASKQGALVSSMFESVLKTVDRNIGQINLSELSIKDVRKSRIVYLLSRPDADQSKIRRQFHLQSSVVRFYSLLAQYKYPKKE